MALDPYTVLGLDAGAGIEEVRAAYHRRSRLLHPDYHGDAPEDARRESERAMAQLNDAYRQILAEQDKASQPARTPAKPVEPSPAQRAGQAAGVARSVVRPAFRLGRVVGRRRPSEDGSPTSDG